MSSPYMMSGSRTTSTGFVRGSVEETLNALLEAEADRLCNARRYERSEARRDTRAGHYERKLQSKAGEVRLKVPKLRAQTFETAIIERYRRRESSVEEALIEMYLAGVSVRRVEDITEALWGTRVSPSRCAGDRGHAQGDPRQRGHCGAARKGCPSGREIGGAAADQGRRALGAAVEETLTHYAFPRSAILE
jgi:hypothetical protein